jgi:hypothetical protein
MPSVTQQLLLLMRPLQLRLLHQLTLLLRLQLALSGYLTAVSAVVQTAAPRTPRKVVTTPPAVHGMVICLVIWTWGRRVG